MKKFLLALFMLMAFSAFAIENGTYKCVKCEVTGKSKDGKELVDVMKQMYEGIVFKVKGDNMESSMPNPYGGKPITAKGKVKGNIIVSEDGSTFKVDGNSIILEVDDNDVKIYSVYKKK